MDALTSEINRIADSSNFNGINLLDGSLSGAAKITTTPAAASTAGTVVLDFTGLTGNSNPIKAGADQIFSGVDAGTKSAAALATFLDAKTLTIDGHKYTAAASGTKVTLTAQTKGDNSLAAATFALTGATGTATAATVTDGTDAVAAGAKLDFTGVNSGKEIMGSTVTVDNTTYQFVTDAANVTNGNTAVVITDADTATTIAGNLATAITNAGTNTATDGTDGTLTVEEATAGAGVSVSQTGGGLKLQIGDTADSFNQMSVMIDDMHASNLGIDVISVKNQSAAADAIDVIKNAINQVSATRGTLGATQNRLEHTTNNLSVMTENIQDAESTIRDTDIAEEMMSYTKNNILVQSAQAMLAQANTVPQGVLQLLQ
jgi:flagellin